MEKKYSKNVYRCQHGFSLIELLIYLAIVGIVMTLVVTSFTGTLTRSGQQTTIAGTQIETGIGLDILRRDLEHAGFGLPWGFQNPTITYIEPAPFSGAATSLVPPAFSSQDSSALSLNTSDYLVIRASNIARGAASQKWGFLGRDVSHLPQLESMNQSAPFQSNDLFIVLNTEEGSQYRNLIMNGTGYHTNLANAALNIYAPPSTPNDPDGARYIAYGLRNVPVIGPNDIRRPFHRVDYYINTANVPAQCAPSTGVLGKMQINQVDNAGVFLPLVDCVADFQVVYYLDTTGDGSWDARANANTISSLTQAEIRDQVKRVGCYILAHEGSRDTDYTIASNLINVGETNAAGALFPNAGRTFDIQAQIGGANWANYRWKVYSLMVNPKNLQ